MTSGDNCAWAQIRRAYEGDDLTVMEICKRYKITRYALSKRRKAEGWLIRPKIGLPKKGVDAELGETDETDETDETVGEASCLVGEAQATAMVQPVRSSQGDENGDGNAGLMADKGDVIARLYRAIKNELGIIEDRMGKSENRTPADSERDARSIGLLIRNLEKLTGFDEQVRGGGDKQQSISGITADEADQLRRELTQRIEKIVASEKSPDIS